jgi:hypothetical protein
MAKLNVGKQFELSKSLTTEAGGELEEPLQYLSELGEQVLRALRNQLTFADNFSCEIKATKLRHNVAIPIEIGNRRPTMVLPLLVRSTRYALTQPLRYYFDANGKFNVIGMFCDLLPMQRYPELDCSGGPTIVVDQSQTPFNIGDLVFVDSVSGGSYVDQLATVTNRTSSSFTLTLVGTGSARRVAVSGHLVKPVSRATDIPVDLLILF